MRKSFSNFTQQVYLCTTEVAYGGQTNAWFVSQSDRPEQQYSDPGYKKGQIQEIIMPSRHCLPYSCCQQEEPGVYLIDVVDNCERET